MTWRLVATLWAAFGMAVAVTVSISLFGGSAPATTEPPPSAVMLSGFATFVDDVQAASYYGSWVAANCGATSGGTPAKPTPRSDAGRWYTFRDGLLGVLASHRPAVPVMRTKLGKALVDAGELALNG